MTREQKHKAIEMRIDGCTYEKIGKELGITKQGVYLMFQNLKKNPRREYYLKRISNIPYLGLRKYMEDHEQSFLGFGKKIYGERCSKSRCSCTLYKKLVGEKKLNLDEINSILSVTGMTFEQCFEKKTDELQEVSK